ncbi:MAG: hypothetical protein BJ554DRAFT_6772 [Olpidium bornovanus]|uniref:Peptidase M14 domain-containing protein n=1 Tax=Olpidium bornovanus TaxID=278681 RepID=A0A8H8DJY7_9FUNG|nr:MAG: hypothetical protein BJ554DRAFT_6772 [Olpidium bornovanus]
MLLDVKGRFRSPARVEPGLLWCRSRTAPSSAAAAGFLGPGWRPGPTDVCQQIRRPSRSAGVSQRRRTIGKVPCLDEKGAADTTSGPPGQGEVHGRAYLPVTSPRPPLSLRTDIGVDAWSPLRLGFVDVRLSPRSYNQSMLPFVTDTGVKTETLIENLRALVEEENRALHSGPNLIWDEVVAALRHKDPEGFGMCSAEDGTGFGDSDCEHRKKRNRKKRRKAQPVEKLNPFFNTYRNYSDISKYLNALEAEYPVLVKAFSVGKSFQNEPIGAIRISSTKYTAQVAENVEVRSFESEEAESWDVPDEEISDFEVTDEVVDAFGMHYLRRGSQRRRQKHFIGTKRANHGEFVGRSAQNGKESEKKSMEKRHIVIGAGQHAREWIAPVSISTDLAVALYIATKLTTKYGQEKWATRLVDAFDWTVIPVINPDGYQYTHGWDRMWRKNREPTPNPLCVGVDTNRNWDFKWRNGVGPEDPCSDDYIGPKAFSSRESRAVADYILNTPPVAAFIDLHAYSMSWMSPFGGDCKVLPSDNEDILECAQGAVKALYKVNRRQFRAGSVCDVSYKSSGLAIDWAYAVAGVKYSYSINLRDKGKYGFLLPSDQIVPSGEETYTAVLAMARFILNREKFRPV